MSMIAAEISRLVLVMLEAGSVAQLLSRVATAA